MSDAFVAVGLILALEGALYALFPDGMKRMSAQVLQAPVDTLRIVGLIAVAIGVAIVWMVRG